MGLWGSSFAVIAHGVQTDTAARWASLFILVLPLEGFYQDLSRLN